VIACTNEYEALTPEALAVCDDFARMFKKYVQTHPDFAVRELDYLACQGIGASAAEIVLRNAVTKRKQRHL
jgi:hypothetical protein